ncbi:excisionase family DNA binding protein [Metabacillus crassostreae]|uniref:helix-turn-helix domain-containing protein n=1 Tax=Metabacillus crassostreae TaxID=929098 RepID=UPI001956C160|nr:helix-turn-helix domain-containing protein [Metabacillus crassostreae]MBM7604008.1 excisionase family DNA binding protein [Metabacillus crassostreae]
MNKSLNEYPDVLKVTDTCEILGVGRNKAYELANSNLFPIKKIGRTILIPKEPFVNWLNSNEIK